MHWQRTTRPIFCTDDYIHFMCAVRRTTSTRLTRLAAKASPYHGAVTVHEAPSRDLLALDSEVQAGLSTLRRSSRAKHEPTVGHATSTSSPLDTAPDDDDDDTSHARRTVAAKAVMRTAPRLGRGKKVKPEAEVSNSDAPSTSASSKKRKPTSKPKTIPQALDVPHPAPAKWAEAYAAIKDMRSRIVAPVDTMGCEQAQLKERDPKVGSGEGVYVVSSRLRNIDVIFPLHTRISASRRSFL